MLGSGIEELIALAKDLQRETLLSSSVLIWM
jgi:hypothetical protein